MSQTLLSYLTGNKAETKKEEWKRYWEIGRHFSTVVDQREIQSRFGDPAYPYYYACVAAVYFPPTKYRRVIDLTYGEGYMWMVCGSWYEVTAVDIKVPSRFHHRPDHFIQADFREVRFRRKFDVVVFDPPYPLRLGYARNDKRVEMYGDYVHVSDDYYVSLLEAFPKAANSLTKRGSLVVVKLMDVNRNGYIEYKLSHFYLVDLMLKAGFKLRDYLIYRFLNRVNFPHKTKFKKKHSYLLIFERV